MYVQDLHIGNTTTQQHNSKMAQQDTSVAIADSITEQYAGVVDDLIADCHRLEDQVAELTRQRDRAIAERDRAIAERDAALEGETGDLDLRSYCESCNKLWHRDYVTWFKHPYHNDAGASCYSACGNCSVRLF